MSEPVMDTISKSGRQRSTVEARRPFVQDTNTVPTKTSGVQTGLAQIIQHCLHGFSRPAGAAEVLSSHVMTKQFTLINRTPAVRRGRQLSRVSGSTQPRAHPTEARLRRELFQARGLRVTGLAQSAPDGQRPSMSVFLSCGLRGFPAAIVGQFSSSLSPSFARGRRTTGFLQAGCVA